MKKSNKELLEDAAKLAVAHQQKKEVIEKIFSDLDKEEKMSSKHLSGIAAVNDLLKELKILEEEYSAISEQIKQG